MDLLHLLTPEWIISGLSALGVGVAAGARWLYGVFGELRKDLRKLETEFETKVETLRAECVRREDLLELRQDIREINGRIHAVLLAVSLPKQG